MCLPYWLKEMFLVGNTILRRDCVERWRCNLNGKTLSWWEMTKQFFFFLHGLSGRRSTIWIDEYFGFNEMQLTGMGAQEYFCYTGHKARRIQKQKKKPLLTTWFDFTTNPGTLIEVWEQGERVNTVQTGDSLIHQLTKQCPLVQGWLLIRCLCQLIVATHACFLICLWFLIWVG
jgi:hypothetical protein